ncbi:FAD-dependent oxidoreductase [Rhodococcus opacus]
MTKAPSMARRAWRVAVVGSGPSGVYATEELLRVDGMSVDVIDRLPTPYGLLRYGVAPDHFKMKSLVRAFERVLSDPRVTFIGNVEVGRDVATSELHDKYDAVLYATGAAGSRTLSIAGEELDGCVPAADFVAWYNGHPDSAIQRDWVTAEDVVVIGAGNVALDVARMLAKPVEEISQTDVPDTVLETFSRSEVKDIHVVARKGPAQTRFTYKELAEFGQLPDVGVVAHISDEDLHHATGLIDPSDRNAVLMLDLFSSWRNPTATYPKRVVHFHFGLVPQAIEGRGRVEHVIFEQTGGAEQAIAAQMVFSAVGSRGEILQGLPFDAESGVVPHDGGRVSLAEGGRPREYVVGWIKRGPHGVVGTNRADAVETVAALLEDLNDMARQDSDVARSLNGDSIIGGPHATTWGGWLAIDAAEVANGQGRGTARVKLSGREEMLALADCVPGLRTQKPSPTRS